MADGKFAISERSISIRNVVGLSAILLMCVALSSCSGNRPEKAFMGTWKGTYDGETAELSFMEKDIFIFILTSGESHEIISGTWTIDPEGNAVMTVEDEDEKGIATLLNDDKIIVREEGNSKTTLWEKSDSKKK